MLIVGFNISLGRQRRLVPLVRRSLRKQLSVQFSVSNSVIDTESYVWHYDEPGWLVGFDL